MRESIGATWIFTIVLTFIILMTAYLAISVNYAKAFKIKSYIVSEIEENEGYDGDLEMRVRNYLTAQGYTAYGTCDQRIENSDWHLQHTIDDAAPTGSDKHNVCIYERNITTGNDDIEADRTYYRVVVFFKFDLPIVNFLTTFKVGGETAYVYDYSNVESFTPPPAPSTNSYYTTRVQTTRGEINAPVREPTTRTPTSSSTRAPLITGGTNNRPRSFKEYGKRYAFRLYECDGNYCNLRPNYEDELNYMCRDYLIGSGVTLSADEWNRPNFAAGYCPQYNDLIMGMQNIDKNELIREGYNVY